MSFLGLSYSAVMVVDYSFPGKKERLELEDGWKDGWMGTIKEGDEVIELRFGDD